MLTDLVNVATGEMQAVAEDGRSVQALEATLFCISSIHEAVPMDEETAATQLFTGPLVQTITRLTGIRYHRLQRTALRLIGMPWSLYFDSMLSCLHLAPSIPPFQRNMLPGSNTTRVPCCLCFNARSASSAKNRRLKLLH